MSKAAKRNIIVIGETGAGKSSLINMLVGEKVAKTSDKAVGCTFTSTAYDDQLGNRYFDTVGLNESSSGTLSAQEAIKGLTALLKKLSGGVNLIIFVVRKGRITEAMVKNYKVFVSGICDGQVPALLVISHCELDTNPDEWYKENKEHFESCGMRFDEVVSGCFDVNLEKVKPSMHPCITGAYDETTARMKSIMESDRFDKKHSFGNWLNWLARVMRKSWKTLAEFFGWPKDDYGIHENLQKALMKSMGVGEAEATSIANQVLGKM